MEATMALSAPKNVHEVERVARIVLGLALLSLLFFAPVPGWGLVGVVGLVPLLTGYFGSCPIYAVMGLSTRKGSKSGLAEDD
ncbi:MAG: hypothetical protein ACI9MR_000149 [Myxococcota bacterium]|jgi:hypothetical protein